MKTSEQNVNINFKILPFGSAQIKIKGSEEIREAKLEKTSEYGEPKTTNHQIIEITYGGEEHRIPQTTGGLL